MTPTEFAAEWSYIIDERRGMIAGAATLTPEQEQLARDEAMEHMNRLEANDE